MDGITLEKLQVLIEAQTSQFKKEIESVNKQVNSLSGNVNKQVASIKNIFGGIGKVIAAIGIGKYIKDSIISAMESIESDNLFETVFGGLSDQMREWSNNLQNTLGVNAYSARNNAAVLFNIASTMGVAKDSALGLSKSMTLLSEDMASFYNLDSSEAFNKIKSGLTGETEPLKSLGILVDENTLKQYGYSSSMSNAEKVMVRYKAILAQTSTAQGDLARTINSPSNQLRLLRNNLSVLSIELGKAFVPIVQVVLPILNAFVLNITSVVSSIATFMNSLFGSSINTSTANVSALASSTSDYNNALADTGDTAKKTNKEVNRLLGGFDEINSLNKNSDDSNNNGSSSIPSVSAPTIGAPNMTQTQTATSAWAESFRSILAKIWQPFQDSWAQEGQNTINAAKYALEGVWNLISSIGKSFVEVWSNGTGTKILTTIYQIFQNIFGIIGDVANSFANAWNDNGLGTSIIQHIADAIQNVLTLIKDVGGAFRDWWAVNGQEVATAVLGIIDTISSNIENLSVLFKAAWDNGGNLLFTSLLDLGKSVIEVISDWEKKMSSSKESSKSFGDALGWALGEVSKLVEYVANHKWIIETFLGLFTTFKTVEFVTQMVLATKQIVEQIIQFGILTGKKIADKLETLALVGMYTKDFIVKIATATGEIVKQIIQFGILTGAKVLDAAKTGIMTAATNIMAAAQAALNFVMSLNPITLVVIAIGGLIAILVTAYNKCDWFRNMVNSAFNGIKNTALGLGSAIKNAFSSIWGPIKGFINGMIGGINSVINKLNSISVDIPDTVPSWLGGGSHFGIKIPKIPYLAKGGIVDSGQMFVAGEAGKEAIMPLERNTGWIDNLAQQLMSKMPTNNVQNSSSSGDLTVELYMGYDKLGDAVIKAFRKMENKTGNKILNI